MEKIIPFRNEAEALKSLDNGGRFYNVFTKANDDIITPQEVGKVAGVFFEPQQSVLFLTLAMSGLTETVKESIRSRFNDRLQKADQTFKPQEIITPPTNIRDLVGRNVIVNGVPALTESSSKLSGFILVPAGKAFTMIPVIDSYDIYEIRNQQQDELFIIAHKKGKEKLPQQPISMGGVVKEIKTKKDNEETLNWVLEINYFITES